MTSGCPPSRHWLLFGSDTEPTPPLPLRAGPLRLLYDPANGFIRRICLGENEVLRGVYAAVRDRNWGTVPGSLRETRREVGPGSFHLEFESEHRQGDINFVWRGVVRGEADGTLRYEFDAEARSTFLRNRVGFCVLHPIRECAGARARQRRVDGSRVECRFPDTIEPQIFGQSSFRDLRAVAHEFAPGLWVEVEFDGDVFEMEDQRNWTDASFKTYCTPLAQPFPIEIQAGTRVQQSVTLRLLGSSGGVASARVEIADQSSEVVTIAFEDGPTKLCPRIGLGLASHGEELTDLEVSRLRALRLAHLRVDLRLSTADWPLVWERAVHQAAQLGAGLELALHLPPVGTGNAQEFQRLVRREPGVLARVLALREGEAATTPGTLRLVRQTLTGVDVPVGAGSDANFCELNREQALGRLALAEADFIFWSINPQVHAFDSLSVVETLEAQADTARAARAFAGGKPLVISPVTLKPRFNAVATQPLRSVSLGELPPAVDPRQLSLFTAAWTLGSLAVLADAGASDLTFYETTGWRGVMECGRGSPLPDQFPSLPGAVFPVYHVFADLTGLDRLVPCRVSAPSSVVALACRDAEGHCKMLLGNLTTQSQRVRLHTSAPAMSLRALAEDNVVSALRAPEHFRALAGEIRAACGGIVELDLPAHALACLEDDGSVPSKPS